jgi:hypothetical protein
MCLVVAHVFRAVVRFLFDKGSLLDPHSGDNVDVYDYNNSILEQAVCLVADVLMAMSVLALIYFKNKGRHRPTLNNAKRCGFSDLYGGSRVYGQIDILDMCNDSMVSEQKPVVPSVGNTSDSVGHCFSLNSERVPMTEISRKIAKSGMDT